MGKLVLYENFKTVSQITVLSFKLLVSGICNSKRKLIVTDKL